MHNKFILVIIFALLTSSYGLAQEEPQTTTFYVVRHADRDGSNDALTEAGHERAQQLKDLMKILGAEEVYSTDTIRTKSTAKPFADSLEKETKTYGNLNEPWFQELKVDNKGKVVLIVGHSDTSGKIVKGLGGQGDFSIEENEFDSLFVVTILDQDIIAIRLRYGE